MISPRLYNGARLVNGPSPSNIDIIDRGAMPMIASMQHTGLQVDLSHFAKMDVILTRDMEERTERVKTLTGHYINIDSGDQVSNLLFKCGLLDSSGQPLKQARPKMTKSGDRESVEDEVLTAIQHEHPVVPVIQEYKEFSKLRGTYVRPMPKLATRVAHGIWRMFPNFKNTRVPSGRLSCSDPNLLAMPTRTKRGREIRLGFITYPGWVLLSVDESQIEPRLAAHRSKDANLLKVYLNDEDIYSDYAISAFKLQDGRYWDKKETKWKYPHVDKDEHRRPCKTCVLAALYDVSAGGLLDQMPVVCANCGRPTTADKEGVKVHDCNKFRSLWTEPKCQDLLNAFYIKYEGLLRMRKADHRYARSHGYICDMFGRVLHVAAVYSVLEWVVSAALREVGNFPLQSGAQGTIKLTMAAVMDDLTIGGPAALIHLCHPLLQVHDELIFEVREDLADEIGGLVGERFATCVPLDIPIKSGIATAASWGLLEK